MRTVIFVLSAAIVAAGCTHAGGAGAGAHADGAAGLATVLAGRVAGPPRDCVGESELGGNRSYGRDVIVFSGRTDDVLYVNRPLVGCPELSFGRALRVTTTTGQLCRGDIVSVFDPSTGMEFGSCALGQFTPYRLAR